MRRFLIAVIIVLCTYPVWGADYYIAQSSAGSGNGSNCSNANAIASLTWGDGNMVKAGDTLHLCGTITSKLSIGASGSEGSTITVIFESGAGLTTSAWGETTNAAISASNRSYITIDGNNVGVIRNTDNGTALGTQQRSTGIYVSGGTNWTIKNLTIEDIYQRTPRSDTDSNDYGIGINTTNVSNLIITNTTINGAYYCLVHTATSGNPAGLTINNNDLSQMSTGIKIALDAATNYSNISIHDNKIYDSYVWDGSWGAGSWFHRDGIHTWGNQAANSLGPIAIYNNEFSGDWGVSTHVTGFIYLTDYTFPATIYNNLFVPSSGTASNGYIDYHCYSASGDVKIYNNTFDGPSATSSGYNAIYLAGAGGGTADIANNIVKDVYIAVYDNSTSGFAITSDYNLFYNLTSVGRRGDPTWYESLGSWQTYLGGCPETGNDCNSLTSDPSINASYKPSSESSPVVGTGLNLYQASTVTWHTDKDGGERGTTGTWDIGAYEYQAPPTYLPWRIQ